MGDENQIVFMYVLFFFLLSVFAHPFENNLLGHQIFLDVQEKQLALEYSLEMPIQSVQEEYASFEKTNGSDKKEEFLAETYKEIISNLQMEINAKITTPMKVERAEVEARNNGQFMVFSSRIIYSLPENLQTISLVNQKRIFDPAIYKNEINISQKWTVADTDMIVWKEKKPHASLMKKWIVEEELREVRLSFFANNWWSESVQWWNEDLLGEEPSLGLWTHLKRQRQTWVDDWKQGRTSLSSFLVIFSIWLLALSVNSNFFSIII